MEKSRTLALIDRYKKSKFGEQFTDSMYPIFQALTSLKTIRDWIDINNERNSNRLFSWISEIEEIDAETGDIKKLDRIISTSIEAKNLAKIINDDRAIKEMEDTRSFADGYSISHRVNEERVHNLLKSIESRFIEANRLSSFLTKKSEDKLEVIEELINRLKSKKEQTIFSSHKQESETFMNFKSKALSQIDIVRYKKITNLKIENLNRINIFAGINNSGKTSLLEAIDFLINQNDIYNFLDMQRRRGKFIKLNSLWLDSEFLNSIELKGVFNYVPISVKIDKKREKNDNINKDLYLSTIEIESLFGDDNLSSSARLFEDKSEKFYKTIKIVCNNAYSSPFSIQNKSDLEKHYARAVSKNVLNDILDFIKEHIDNDLQDIRFTKEYVETFKVNHKEFTIDLSNFGEGLQRVFYIALQFASAQNGVIFIDELENGLHYTLLESFTKFIQKLAVKLNVQVFLTTHSKETIEAFVSNGFNNEDISFYRLTQSRRTGEINTIKYDSSLLLEEFRENQEVRGW